MHYKISEKINIRTCWELLQCSKHKFYICLILLWLRLLPFPVTFIPRDAHNNETHHTQYCCCREDHRDALSGADPGGCVRVRFHIGDVISAQTTTYRMHHTDVVDVTEI